MRNGRIAAHTGATASTGAGTSSGDGFSIAGNMLAGARVLDDTAQAYVAERDAAVRAPPDRGDAGRRGGRRRQARQAIGGAADPRRGGMVRCSTCASTTTPIRSPSSTRLEAGQPRALGAFPPVPAEPRATGRHHRPREHRRRHRQARIAEARNEPTAPLLEIEDLRVVFHGDDGRTRTRSTASTLSVARGRTLGIVGESGCGKSVTSLPIMGLLPKLAREVSGSIRFDGLDLLDVPDADAARPARQPAGDDLPGADDLAQSELHDRRPDRRDASCAIAAARGAQARERAIELLRRVRIPSPERAPRRLSAQALGRHAPARDDRDGAGLRSRSC